MSGQGGAALPWLVFVLVVLAVVALAVVALWQWMLGAVIMVGCWKVITR